jgi:hypothetical protein
VDVPLPELVGLAGVADGTDDPYIDLRGAASKVLPERDNAFSHRRRRVL